MNKKTTLVLLIGFILVIIQNPVNAQTIYVDSQLSANCTGNYSIANRNCSGSDGDAYRTLAGAANAATAGITVLIRAGSFSEQLSPQNSGEAGNYITFKNYQNEVVEITGESLSPAIWIEKKDYIAIEGLQIREVKRWLNALGSNYLIIKDNIFEKALDAGSSSKTGIFLQSCNNTQILTNKMHDTTQDNLGMVDCDYNLIEGNTMTKGLHALWALKCSNYNIIRNNYFHNELQKIGEIYDCDNSGFGSTEFPKLNSLDDTKYNVVEGNVFAYTPSSGDASPYAGIQYAAQNGIIRNNMFYECTGPGLSLTIYGGEASNNYENRIYHNIFYNNELGGINISGSEDYNFGDQKLTNNIFYKNTFTQNDMRWSWYAELDGETVHILTAREQDVLFNNTNIFPSSDEELYAIAYGARHSTSNRAPQPLSWWEENRTGFIKNTLQADPLFANLAYKDFHLQENSPMIDAGAFLASTTNSGAGSTTMVVDDAGWFTDGFGISSGDTIQLEGQTDWAIITAVNYASNTLTLNRPLTWNTNKGVSLPYHNAKPDVGAFEYDPDYVPEVVASVENNLVNNGISLYPNPLSDFATLTYEHFSGKPYELNIIDMKGRIVQSIDSISTKSLIIEKADLIKGIYLYQVYEGKIKIGSGRLIVE